MPESWRASRLRSIAAARSLTGGLGEAGGFTGTKLLPLKAWAAKAASARAGVSAGRPWLSACQGLPAAARQPPARCRGVSATQASLPPSRHDRRCGRCRLSMAIRHYLGIAKKAEFSDEVLAWKREQALKRLGVGEPILRWLHSLGRGQPVALNLAGKIRKLA